MEYLITLFKCSKLPSFKKVQAYDNMEGSGLQDTGRGFKLFKEKLNKKNIQAIHSI